MLKELLSCLRESGHLADDLEGKSPDELYEMCRGELRETQAMQVGEFGRSVHAEMAAIEYVDRPGEIRAARPPKSRVMDAMDDAIEDVGIKSIRR